MDAKNPPPVHSSLIRSIPSTSNIQSHPIHQSIDQRHRNQDMIRQTIAYTMEHQLTLLKVSVLVLHLKKTMLKKLEQTNKQTGNQRLLLQFPTELRSYVKLQKEITRCRPQAKILNAYINSRNQLVIDPKHKKTQITYEKTGHKTPSFMVTNQPQNIIKAIINDSVTYFSITKDKKIKLGHSIIRVAPWKSDRSKTRSVFQLPKIRSFLSKRP
ncbi:hypothetical protein BpHYR1_024313 [Brachionus plicatilis]|uniref:Uncharacterized protein n=1 Tax=Brachionus plicatilis TaxID=10195 RepID=A0A3M7QM18_BRAPC|nr:hypothetical protein BpHYR1_024313 [Brachionus plicatilis]